jgi:hypothetical protein
MKSKGNTIEELGEILKNLDPEELSGYAVTTSEETSTTSATIPKRTSSPTMAMSPTNLKTHGGYVTRVYIIEPVS